MAAAATSNPGEQEISIQNLSLEQLDSLKTQLEGELRQFTTSYAGLKEAQARFTGSNLSLDAITPENEGKSVFVPLTPSMYVPAKLSDTNHVLVDIGTGYYVEKEVKDAKSFLDRKIAFLQTNTDSLQELMDTKRSNLEMVIGMMQQKLKALEQQGGRK